MWPPRTAPQSSDVGNSDEAPFIRYWQTIDREGARYLRRLPDPDQAPIMVLAQPEQVRLSHAPHLLQVEYQVFGPKHNEAKPLKSCGRVHGHENRLER